MASETSKQPLPMCRHIASEFVRDPATSKILGRRCQCSLKLEAKTPEALYDIIGAREQAGIQGVAGASDDCPIADAHEWERCPLWEA